MSQKLVITLFFSGFSLALTLSCNNSGDDRGESPGGAPVKIRIKGDNADATGNPGNTGNAGNSGNNGDADNTGNSGNSGNTGNNTDDGSVGTSTGETNGTAGGVQG